VDEVVDSLDVEGFLDFSVGCDKEVENYEGCWEDGEEEIWVRLALAIEEFQWGVLGTKQLHLVHYGRRNVCP